MKNKSLRKGINWMKVAPYFFIAPAVIYIICVTIIPMIMALPISFTNWSALSPRKKFVGLANYKTLIHDKDFWSSMLVMAKFFIYVPLVMAAGLGAALLLNTKTPGTVLQGIVLCSSHHIDCSGGHSLRVVLSAYLWSIQCHIEILPFACKRVDI